LRIVSDSGETSSGRIAARFALITCYRIQRAEIERGLRRAFHAGLWSFVREAIRASADNADPLGAVESFLAAPPSRTRGRKRLPHRDFVIAVDVAEKIELGDRTEDACSSVAEAAGLSDHQVRRIYFAQRKRQVVLLKADLARRRAERKAVSSTVRKSG